MAVVRRFVIGACAFGFCASLAGCSYPEESCEGPIVDLAMAEGESRSVTLSFAGDRCDVVVPGPDGFSSSTPEFGTCGSGTRRFRVWYLRSDPNCQRASASGDAVTNEYCTSGEPMTRLLYDGPLGDGSLTLEIVRGAVGQSVDVLLGCKGRHETLALKPD